MIDKKANIYIAGHHGMVGSAIKRNLLEKGYSNFIERTSAELDLRNQQAVADFFAAEKPDYVILAAAKVGGIIANSTYRAQFIYENLMIQNNVIHQSYLHEVKKLLFLGSSCIYPRMAAQPIKEEYLLTGLLEETNEPYAIAKIAGIKMCEAYHAQYACNFISVMPTNLYGLNDNYDLENSHVLPALIRKMFLAKCLMEKNWHALRHDLNKRPVEGVCAICSEKDILAMLNKYGVSSSSVKLWGTGKPLREFLYADDMADACVFLLMNYDAPTGIPSHVNIGCGEDLSIADLANIVKETIDYKGSISWDTTKPDGTPRKLLDVSKLNALGWKQKTSIQEGIKLVFENYTR